MRLNVGADRFGLGEADTAAAASAWLRQQRGENGYEQANAELARTMWAVRDAKPVAGKFPVVIYEPSINSRTTSAR